MTKLQIILLCCVLLSFGAGFCSGALYGKKVEKHDDWLSELNLEPEQHKKIKDIWSEVMKTAGWPAQREKRDAIWKERDEAVKALMTPEQLPHYDEIIKASKDKQNELAQQNKKLMDEATEKTKALLTEAQRVKYDEIRQRRFGGHKKPEGAATPSLANPPKPN